MKYLMLASTLVLVGLAVYSAKKFLEGAWYEPHQTLKGPTEQEYERRLEFDLKA